VTQAHRAASAPPLRAEAEEVVYRNPEFLGATSYTSVFRENLGNLGVASADLDTSEVKNTPIRSDLVEEGCKILRSLFKQHNMDYLVSRWFEVCGGLGGVCTEEILKSWLWKFWLMHGKTLEEQDPDKILRLSELLWRNTRTPLVFNGNTTAQEWIDLGTGANIRWEVIGILAAICGVSALVLDKSDSVFKEIDATALPPKMMQISETCVRFCREFETLDDMFLWLLAENASLMACIKGDSSYVTYQAGGELLNAVVAMGLHQVIEANERVPFFLAELRKGVLTTAYCGDVSYATFLGRPPRISHRYCILEPPIDLSGSQLLLGKEEMQKVIDSLDKNGFSTNRQMARNTWSRAWLPFGMRREDILDLALANHYTREEIIQRAAEIQRKSEEHWETLPEFIQNARQDDILSKTEGALPTIFMALFRQGSRANELLLQRVLIRKTGARPEKLIHTARAIFKDVLEMSYRQDLMANYRLDLTAHLVVHGLRTSAILAVELLKQEQLPMYPKDPLLPRSQTIRDLSVFASRLESIPPSDGMYSICRQGHKVISRILDKILSPPNPAAEPVDTTRQFHPPQSHQLGEMELDVMGSNAAPIGDPYMAEPLAGDITFGAPDPILVHDTDFMFMQWLDNSKHISKLIISPFSPHQARSLRKGEQEDTGRVFKTCLRTPQYSLVFLREIRANLWWCSSGLGTAGAVDRSLMNSIMTYLSSNSDSTKKLGL
jgi:hypothetical protein